MTVTTKGRRWEILHSLWIGWTFTLGLFNWIAFLYVGLRTKQRKWIFWALIYSVPLIAVISTRPESLPGWLSAVVVVLWLGLWIASIFHAFKIRKEYLLRLEIVQTKAVEKETELRRRLHAEMRQGKAVIGSDTVAQEEAAGRSAALAIPEAPPTPEVGERGSVRPPTRTTSPSAPASSPIHDDVPEQAQRTAPSNGKNPITVARVKSGDELEHEISSSYPFPIAFGFRSLASIVDVRDLYREQLRIAENILAFLGSVSLALLQEQGHEQAKIDPAEFWQSGISPGDWREIVGRCSKLLDGHENDRIASAIRGLNIRSEKKGFGADVIALIRAKNDYKHDRGPTVLEDVADASGEAQEKLKRCMEALAFFTEFPIRQVEDFDVSRRGDSVVLKCLPTQVITLASPRKKYPFTRDYARAICSWTWADRTGCRSSPSSSP